MELRRLALTLLETDSLEVKLTAPPPGCTDAVPGEPVVFTAPVRPAGLRIQGDTNVPPIEGMHDPHQRGRIVHALANHEFQAVELFAWAILAFAEAPPDFRHGLLDILQDEQKHCRLYIARARAHGVDFGAVPVSGYFWSKIRDVHTPLQFVCVMSLTFENANLDHTVEYARAARAAGDEETARVIEVVEADEVEHVHFGWHWLGRFKEPTESMETAYRKALAWPLRPALARGTTFHPHGRVRAGLDDDFIQMLACSEVDPEAKRTGRRNDG